MTRNGALAGMVTGFVCVPVFKFIPSMLQAQLEWAVLDWLIALAELPPAFMMSGCAIIVVSMFDTAGQQRLSHASDHLADAAGPIASR